MSNELTIITFYAREEGALPAVTPNQVADITSAMASIYEKASVLVGYQATVRFDFAAPARKGSLELAFAHSLNIAMELANEGRATAFSAIQGDLGRAMKDWAGVAAFIYTAVFGGRGLVDLKPKGSANPSDNNDELRRKTIDIISNNKQIQSNLQKLYQLSALRSVTRVEVRVFDAEPSTIFNAENRYDIKLLANNAHTSLPLASETAGRKAVGLEFKAISESINATWDGRPSGVLLAEHQGRRSVLIWNPSQRFPKNGEIFFAHVHTPDRARFNQALKVSEAIPLEFEDAVEIYLTGSAFFKS